MPRVDATFDDVVVAELIRPAPRRARRRAWLCVGALALGALLARSADLSASAWAGAAGAAALVALLTPRRLFGGALLAVVVLLGAWWLHMRTATAGARSPQALLGPVEAEMIEAEGLVTSVPRASWPHRDQLARFRRIEPAMSFDVDLASLWSGGRSERAEGRIRVSVGVDADEAGLLPSPGDRVRMKGWYAPPRAQSNPGESDGRAWSNMEGKVGSLFVTSPELIEEIELHGLGWRRAWVRAVASVRGRMLEQIAGDGRHADGRAMLAVLLLGEVEPGLRETRSAFQKSGTAHLLAISGFHLTVLCGLGVLAVRLTGDRGRLEALAVGVLVLALLVLAPAQVPIVRAGVLVLALLAADMLGRRYDRLTLLGWITCGLFIWRPLDVFSLGAQLSVGITALLIWLSSVRHPWVSPIEIRGLRRSRHSVWKSGGRRARSYLVVCVLCWAVATPVVLAHTGTLSLAGPIATAVVTPAMVLLLALGYLALAVGLVSGTAGRWIFDQLAWVSAETSGVVRGFAEAPWLNFQVTPIEGVIAGAGVLVLCVWLVERRVRNPRVLAALVLLVALQLLGPLLRPALLRDVVLRVDTLAVGDGTCHIIRSGNDAMVWDCGSLRVDLRPMLERALPALGVRRARRGVVTHGNLDHYSSLPEAVDLLGIERVLVSPHILSDGGEPERALLALLEEKGVLVEPVARGDAMEFGRGRMEFLWPDESAAGLSDNDRSLVCRISVSTAAGERRVLLTGDIQSETMRRLLEDVEQVKADVLEIPHHGSFRVEAMSFLAGVDPGVVIQSTGSSRVGDPRWADHRASRVWFTTGKDGAAWVEVHEDGRMEAGSVR
ncbi:MAG: DUF4131 domain-containing protein [Leptolyngbya sp. PLA3]|nr:MAG: DUF4131 domain-containing protein [Cyanobacteria bacterium CYA]MCE7967870.1 DUF4131 domain-containing protein [Leptolyngbya sp. PL-A3]